MPLLRRESAHHQIVVPVDTDTPDPAALRRESDVDPVVEEATERLRAALTSLDARDEWGRPIAWRQVARIAIGPLLAQLRDAQTAALLSSATDTAVPAQAPSAVELELFTTPRSGDDGDLPFGLA